MGSTCSTACSSVDNDRAKRKKAALERLRAANSASTSIEFGDEFEQHAAYGGGGGSNGHRTGGVSSRPNPFRQPSFGQPTTHEAGINSGEFCNIFNKNYATQNVANPADISTNTVGDRSTVDIDINNAKRSSTSNTAADQHHQQYQPVRLKTSAVSLPSSTDRDMPLSSAPFDQQGSKTAFPSVLSGVDAAGLARPHRRPSQELALSATGNDEMTPTLTALALPPTNQAAGAPRGGTTASRAGRRPITSSLSPAASVDFSGLVNCGGVVDASSNSNSGRQIQLLGGGGSTSNNVDGDGLPEGTVMMLPAFVIENNQQQQQQPNDFEPLMACIVRHRGVGGASGSEEIPSGPTSGVDDCIGAGGHYHLLGGDGSVSTEDRVAVIVPNSLSRTVTMSEIDPGSLISRSASMIGGSSGTRLTGVVQHVSGNVSATGEGSTDSTPTATRPSLRLMQLLQSGSHQQHVSSPIYSSVPHPNGDDSPFSSGYNNRPVLFTPSALGGSGGNNNNNNNYMVFTLQKNNNSNSGGASSPVAEGHTSGLMNLAEGSQKSLPSLSVTGVVSEPSTPTRSIRRAGNGGGTSAANSNSGFAAHVSFMSTKLAAKRTSVARSTAPLAIIQPDGQTRQDFAGSAHTQE